MEAFKLNRSDYKIIGGYLVIATLWLIFKFYVEKYNPIEYAIDIPVFWLQTIALLFVSITLINHFFIKRRNYLLLILLTLISFWLFGFMTSLSGEISRSGTINWNEMPSFLELIYININSSAANLGIPLMVVSAKKYYEYQLQSSQLSNIQKELELKALKSQFNPHFLYNSLNTIDALVDYSSKEKIKQYISSLSGLYRYLITNKEEEISSVSSEIALAKHYCYVIETRFENDYVFTFHTNLKNHDYYLPNGALVTALENIVKHNKPSGNIPVRAIISVHNEAIKVANTISKNEEIESLGTGLTNLKKRYELLSNKTISITHKTEEFVLTLPLLSVIKS